MSLSERAAATWYETFEVGSYWADMSGVASPFALLQMMQDVAWKHAQALRFGYSDLGARNQFWVLSRLSMHVNRYPQWGETVRLESWTSGTSRLFALRDFRLYDDDEKELMKSVTAWLVVDQETRRPIRPERIVSELSSPSMPSQFQNAPEKLAPVEWEAERPLQYDTRIRYSDIDPQGHANNTRYVSLMLDGLDAEWHRTHWLRRLTVNFVKECTAEDSVRVVGRIDNDTQQSVHSVTRIEDGSVAAALSADWSS
ncbi:MAG: acyl-[acyl-carrier-protein] thioesterase [Spirochaetota bacterium]